MEGRYRSDSMFLILSTCSDLPPGSVHESREKSGTLRTFNNPSET